MHTIKSVGVLSVAKIFGAIYGLMGIVFLPFFLLMSALIPNQNGQNPFGMIGGLVFGLFAPVFYAVMGFVMGAISAFLYNLLAKWVGGIQVQVQTQASAGLHA